MAYSATEAGQLSHEKARLKNSIKGKEARLATLELQLEAMTNASS